MENCMESLFLLVHLFFLFKISSFFVFLASSCILLLATQKALCHLSAEELFRRSLNFGKKEQLRQVQRAFLVARRRTQLEARKTKNEEMLKRRRRCTSKNNDSMQFSIRENFFFFSKMNESEIFFLLKIRHVTRG